LGRLSNTPDSSGGLPVTLFTIAQSPSLDRPEKNWLPLESDGPIRAVSSLDPVSIITIDPETGICETTLVRVTGHDLTRLRGSAPPIPFDGGYLAVVHQVVASPEQRYTHRFVWLDSRWTLVRVSAPFTFADSNIEFCAGMCLAHDSEHLILSVGIDEEQGWLYRVPVDKVRSSLSLIPDCSLADLKASLDA
jgi:hypothetical protein